MAVSSPTHVGAIKKYENVGQNSNKFGVQQVGWQDFSAPISVYYDDTPGLCGSTVSDFDRKEF